jgi:hypothetical protein
MASTGLNPKIPICQTEGISVSTLELHLGSGVHPFLDDLVLLKASPHGHLETKKYIAQFGFSEDLEIL